MKTHDSIKNNIMSIIESLPPNLQAEVGHYADFIRSKYLEANRNNDVHGDWKDKDITQASLSSLWKIWDNDDDAAYDNYGKS